MKFLSDIAHYVNDKIEINKVKACDYVTTENMLPNRDGITENIVLPNVNNVTHYKHNDVLVSNIRPYFKKIWMADREGGCSNDILVFRINDENQVDKKYLYYLLLQDVFFDFVMSGANGTKMPRGNKTLIPNFLIPDYDIATQRRIADILSAYDDLIENNRKQIKLLEEAAQRLYKEWFVDLRFPGHEKVKITDSVPEGWEKGKVEQLACFSRGQMITSDDVIPGDVPVVAGGLQPSCYHNKANTTSPVVTVSASGANAGYIRLYFVDVFASDCSFIDGRSCSCVYFVYCFFRNDVRILRNLQHGSAQPHVYASQINDIVLTIPNRKLIKIFENIVKSYFEEIAFKEKQIKLLQEARDRLLPKLMSGEIEV